MEYEVVTEHSIKFNGRKYCEKQSGYYYNSSTRRHLHQAIWEYYNGPIPEGYEIHHIDFNTRNNDISNLQCLTKSEHRKLHADALTDEQRQWRRDNLTKNARPAASEWHKSDEGRAWHRENAKRMVENGTSAFTRKSELICSYCGKKFIGKPGNCNHFCSNNCKSAFRRASGVDNIEVKCECCGKAFIGNKYDIRRNSKRDGVTVCSVKCLNSIRRGQ